MLRNPLFRFCWPFVLIYGVLIAPWPGWNALYSDYFRNLGTLAFSRDDGARFISFQPYHEQHGFSSLDTRMSLANRNLLTRDGKHLVLMVDLDSRSLGWVPTAFTAALILATPVPWRRRVGSFIGGMILVHLFILFSLATWIWEKSPDLSLATYPLWWQRIVAETEYALITQLGASFSVPLVIWILVTFRRADAERFAFRHLLDFGPARPSGKAR
jgi:hypothetical protein